MKRSLRHLTLPLAALLLVGLLVPATRAADKSPAQMMPATTLFYVELDDPTKLYQTLLDHPLYKRVMELPDVKAAIENNPELDGLKQAVSVFEQQMGMPWRQALDGVTSKGVALGIDMANKGGVLLARGKDAATVNKFRDTVVQFAQQAAEDQGNANAIEQAEYRGITAHKLGEAYVATVGDLMIVTSNGKLGQHVIDAHLGGDAFSLADDSDFKAALASKRKGVTGWAYLKVRTLRDLGVAGDLLRPKNEDPGAEFLLGGVLNALRQAPFLTAEINVNKNDLRLSVGMPHDASKLSKSRQFFFAPSDANGSAPKPLKPDGTMLSISTYRNIAQFWRASPDLFNEQEAAKLAQADQQLSMFFGGRDFGNDILASLEPRFQFIVARQTFNTKGDRPIPAIKLPAFALVMETSKPELMHPYMQVAFTSSVSLVNLGASMQGYPMLMPNNAKRGKATLFSADYLTLPEDKGKKDAHMVYNFTPTMSLHGKHIVLASTRHIAEQVTDLILADKADETVQANTLIEIDPRIASMALRDNKEHLIADSMLKKGNDRATATREVDLLLTALQYIRGADLKLVPDDKTLRVELGLQFDYEK